MKKRQLGLTSAMATTLLALPACSSSSDNWDDGQVYAARDTAVCVNENGERVADTQCNNNRRVGYYGGSGYKWYYLGRNSAVPYYGESVGDPRYSRNGSYTPSNGISYERAPHATNMARSQAVSRGGMGSSARSFGGGRS